jgi:fructose-1,6-bisphosphatase II / sedoheptulose-1,7-bisphosphatase
MDRNLALEAVRVTEAAALAAYRHMGQGDEETADRAAVEAMQNVLNTLPIDGRISIGEGLESEVEQLYTGQKIGTGDGPHVDVALVPLEGSSIIARGGYNAVSVIALSEKGGFPQMPGIYMDKIAIGPGLPDGIVSIDAMPAENLKALAEAKGVAVSDIVVCMLDRPRHKDLVLAVREAGGRIRLILDGDVSGAVAVARPESGVDIYMGIGLAPQGVLAAAGLRAAGGQMQGRLVLRNNEDRDKALKAGIAEPDARYTIADMSPGDVTFAATGITTGPLLPGVQPNAVGPISHSLVMRSRTGTLRYIEAHHRI